MEVKILNLDKSFGKTKVIDNLDLIVKSHEFMTLLGASGCGKTTTLRLILGSISPDNGKIYLNDEDVTNIPCYKRNVGIVYQNYALFPHMTIFENIAFGLKVKHEKNVESKVCSIIEKLRIQGLQERYPNQISGGQQQRVALARTLVVQPKMLLLDEPLSNIDAKLRYEVKHELLKIHKTFGITTLYVTHNIEEALTLSDRIAIMDKGKIVEVGKPMELYSHPKQEYTKQFVGIVRKEIDELNQLTK